MKQSYIKPTIKKLTAGMPAKAGMGGSSKTFSSIDGKDVDDLMNAYGSPLFVISEKTLRSTYRSAMDAFSMRYPKVRFAWSYKTNYLDAVCRVFHQEGSWAEVVSGFEYKKALGNGVPGDKIIFNGPDKTKEELELAIKNKSLIHIDHFDELFLLNQLSTSLDTKPNVAIRVNMDTGVYPVWDRFGFNYENGQAWEAINKIFALGRLNMVGLHCHIGTYMQTLSAYEIAAVKMLDLFRSIRNKFGKTLDYIDMGGGFASKNTLRGAYYSGEDQTPSMGQYADSICNVFLNSDIEVAQLPTIVLETGRALVDDAGYLLGSVLANKRLSDGRRSMVVDFGVNILFTAFWYEHKITPVREPRSQNEDTVIFGPLCMNIDVVRSGASMPPLNPGDRLVVHRVGAYNMTQWLQFISMRPNVVMIDTKDEVHLIREKETLETLTRQEKIPEHLSSIKL